MVTPNVYLDVEFIVKWILAHPDIVRFYAIQGVYFVRDFAKSLR
jgi:hypothetical protein